MKSRLLVAAWVICALAAGPAGAQEEAYSAGALLARTPAPAAPLERADSKPPDTAGGAERAPISKRFDLSRIDRGVVEEFEKAWRRVGAGFKDDEAVLLIFRRSDGAYRAEPQRHAGQPGPHCFSFIWKPNAFAIIHTHPNGAKPQPSRADRRLADRLGVPVLTLTRQGMYMYDPATRATSLILHGCDWLDPARYADPRPVVVGRE